MFSDAIDKLMDKLTELFEELIVKGEQIEQEIKRIIVDGWERMLRRLASREGWDKPAHLAPSGPKEATQANSVEALMRWHTAATGE